VRIVHLTNTGAAGGIFPWAGKVFAALAFLACLAIVYSYPRWAQQGRLVRLALALLLAGALGNLIDRVWQEHVTDFISIGNLPAGNLADLSLLTGVALLLIGVSRNK